MTVKSSTGNFAPMLPILTNGKPKSDPGLRESKATAIALAEELGFDEAAEDDEFEFGGEREYPKLRVSQAKREYYLACQAKFKAQTLEGALVLASDAEKALFDVGREIREGLSSLPSRITDAILLIPEKDKNLRFKILTLLEREINSSLTALSDRSEGERDK